MAKFHLTYNPYRVETTLLVKQEGNWLAVSEESGLLHISKARMQSWLEPTSSLCNGGSYFDELIDASGERRLTIIFSGTREDMSDLVGAAKDYETANPRTRIEIVSDECSARDDSQQRFQRLKNVLSKARTCKFQEILPRDFWRYADQKVFKDETDTVNLIELINWSKGFMFRTGEWQMLCVAFPLNEMCTERFRDKFRDFGECMSKVENRHFERERFLLMCICENDALAYSSSTGDAVKKLLTEYGLHDLRFSVLSTEDFRALSDISIERDNDRLREVKRIVEVFRRRYALQYRVRKMHDALRRILLDGGLRTGTQENLRLIQERMPDWSDQKKFQCDDWIVELFQSIESVLDIGITKGGGNDA